MRAGSPQRIVVLVFSAVVLLVACDVDRVAGPPLLGEVRERSATAVRVCLQSGVVPSAGRILLASRPPNRGARGQGHRHPLISTGHLRVATLGADGCGDALLLDGDVQVGDQLY